MGTPLYLAMNSAASLDPYFTSCLAASILWHVARCTFDPARHDVGEEVDDECAVAGLFADDVGDSGRLALRCCFCCVRVADMCSSMARRGGGMGVCQGGDLTAEGGERRFGYPCRGWVPRIEYGAGSVQDAARERRVGAGDGFRLHGNDGGGSGFFTPHLPAGGHVGPPLRVTRASPGGLAFLTRTAPGRAGFKPAPTGGDLGDWSDWGAPGMGSRLHGNDGVAGDGFPVSSTGQAPLSRERRWWVAGFFTPHLPAGGHVGQPLRLVTRASPSSHSSPAPRRGGRVSNPPLREVTWVIGVIWERGRDCLNQDLWD